MTNVTTDGAKTEEMAGSLATRPLGFGFLDLRDEMDRLWDAILAPRRHIAPLQRLQASPALDVFEKDGQLHVRAELPGIRLEDIDVSITGDVLTISGEKKEEKEVKEENYYRSERSYGKFSRQVALPQGAETDNAAAAFKDGVLEIDIPVKAVESRKTIEVKGAK